jgi:hypothetical protein
VVLDLSLLTATEATRALADPNRPRCISYRVDEHGVIEHVEEAPRPTSRKRLPLLAGSMLLAACNGAPSDGAPAPREGGATVVVASASASASPAPSSSAPPAGVAVRGEAPAHAPADAEPGCDAAAMGGAGGATGAASGGAAVPAPSSSAAKKKRKEQPMMRGFY